MQGTIKHIRADRGFGFILSDNPSEPDIFHATNTGGAFCDLSEGDDVEFDLAPSKTKPDRMCAINVRLIN